MPPLSTNNDLHLLTFILLKLGLAIHFYHIMGMAGILSNNGLLAKSESYMIGFFGFMFFSAHPYTRSVTRERDSRVQLLCEGGGQVMSCPFLDQSRYLIMSGDSKYLFSYCRWPKVSKNTYRDKLCWMTMILTSVKE